MPKTGPSTIVPGVYYFKIDPNQPTMALIKHLEDWLVRDPQGNPQAANLTGEMPIYQIRLRDVPKDFQALIDQIKASDTPIDATPGNQHGAEQNGSMRDVHQNNDKGVVYLPKLAYPKSPTGKAKAYHDYIVANNKHLVQGKQRKKMEQTVGASKPKKQGHPKAANDGDASGGDGTTGFLTGYIEYTVTVPGCTNIRLIYDYVTPRFYISPNHYKPWCRDSKKMGQTVKKPDLAEQDRLSPQGYGLSSFEKTDMYGPHLLVLD